MKWKWNIKDRRRRPFKLQRKIDLTWANITWFCNFINPTLAPTFCAIRCLPQNTLIFTIKYLNNTLARDDLYPYRLLSFCLKREKLQHIVVSYYSMILLMEDRIGDTMRFSFISYFTKWFGDNIVSINKLNKWENIKTWSYLV